MKKILLFLSLCILPFWGYGQTMEVSVSYGTGSLYSAVDEVAKSVLSAFVENHSEANSNGVISLAITRYSTSQKWRYGLDFGLETFKTSEALKSKTYYTLSPKVDYFWSSAAHKFRFYSGLATGVFFSTSKFIDESGTQQSNTHALFGFNFTPIGIRYGRKFGVFLEPINLGTRGIVQLGLSYQF